MNQCSGCRFWSEMVAQSMGGGPVEALALVMMAPSMRQIHDRANVMRKSGRTTITVPWIKPPNYGEFSRVSYEDEDNGPAGREEYPDNGPADPWQTSGPNG